MSIISDDDDVATIHWVPHRCLSTDPPQIICHHRPSHNHHAAIMMNYGPKKSRLSSACYPGVGNTCQLSRSHSFSLFFGCVFDVIGKLVKFMRLSISL